MSVRIDTSSTSGDRSPLEMAKALLESSVQSLPSILQAPFAEQGKSILVDAHSCYTKVLAFQKLQASNSIPKSARFGFSLTASAATKETQQFAALQQQVAATIATAETALRESIVACSKLECETVTTKLVGDIIVVAYKLSNLVAVAHGTDILPVGDFIAFGALALHALYEELAKIDIIKPVLPIRRQFLLDVQAKLTVVFNDDWFSDPCPWSSHVSNLVRKLKQVLLDPIQRLGLALEERRRKVAVSKSATALFGSDPTADATMQVDNEPTVTPAIMAKLIRDAVQAELRKQPTASTKRGNPPNRSKSKSKPKPNGNGNRNNDDDDSATSSARPNKRGSNRTGNKNNNNGNNNNNSNSRSRTTSAKKGGDGASSGKEPGGASSGASSKKQNGNKKARVDDNASQRGNGKKRGKKAQNGRSRSKSQTRNGN
jgi:hypothetical protein